MVSSSSFFFPPTRVSGKVRRIISPPGQFLLVSGDQPAESQSTMAHIAETTVDEHSLTSCV